MQSSSSEKKLVKPLKSCFWTQFAKKRGHYGPCLRWKKFFFLAEITKADHQLSESFYFIKIYVLTELWIYFYLEWYFLSKKCHFQLSHKKANETREGVDCGHMTVVQSWAHTLDETLGISKTKFCQVIQNCLRPWFHMHYGHDATGLFQKKIQTGSWGYTFLKSPLEI